MVEFTFLEVHLDGAEFTANAPGSDASESNRGSTGKKLSIGGGTDDGDEGLESDGGSSALPVVFAFVALVVAVVLFRRVLGGSGEPVYEE